MTEPKPRKLSPGRRAVLEFLSTYEGIIGAGITAGEVQAAGLSRSALYEAMRAGWVNRYPKDRYADKSDVGAPKYYRTNAGTEVLNECPAVAEVAKIRVGAFDLDVDRRVWRAHFGDMPTAEMQADVQAAVEAWATNYIAELARSAES